MGPRPPHRKSCYATQKHLWIQMLPHPTGPSPTCHIYPNSSHELLPLARLAGHSTTYNLLPVEHSAHRVFHSTETAVASVCNDLVLSVDNGTVSLLITLDLSAAFDTVDHPPLLSVLAERFSRNSTALSWLKSFTPPNSPKPSVTLAGRIVVRTQ